MIMVSRWIGESYKTRVQQVDGGQLNLEPRVSPAPKSAVLD